MMKALVTGGNGFLGHYIVRHLLGRGIGTIIFDRRKMTDSEYRRDLFRFRPHVHSGRYSR